MQKLKLISNFFTGITAVLLLLNLETTGQVYANDMMLITEHNAMVNKEHRYYHRPGNDQQVLRTHEQGAVAKFNPVALALKGSMYVYQNVISPQLARNCPYEITCSNFSKQSIKEFGIFKGVFVSADRILRCNRIGILDVHPLDINERTGTIADSPNKYK